MRTARSGRAGGAALCALGLRRIAIILALSLLMIDTSLAQISPESIKTRLDQLRRDWPQVSEARFIPGRRLEYRDGLIRIGADSLAELAALPDDSRPAMLAFLLAHEAWHAVQAGIYSPSELRRMRDLRSLECEADFMGAAAASRVLKAEGRTDAEMTIAHDRLMFHMRGRADLTNRDASYPPIETRTEAMKIGWAQGRAPGLIRYVGRAAPSSERERALETCRKLVRISDSSIGLLELFRTYPPSEGATHDARIELTNKSARPVIANLLALVTLDPFEPKVMEVQDIIVEVAPGAKRAETMTFGRYQLDASRADGEAYSSMASVHHLISYYADPEPQQSYCVDRISAAPAAQDRMLLARIGAIATAAADDFAAIASARAWDEEHGRTTLTIPALNLRGSDSIRYSEGKVIANADLFVTEHDEELSAEFSRVVTLLKTVCGERQVRDLPKDPGADPLDKGVEVLDFAARAKVKIHAWSVRTFPSPSEGKPQLGGWVRVAVERIAARKGGRHQNASRAKVKPPT